MTIREALLSMGYSESKPGQWIKPVGYQAFHYHEGRNEWIDWFTANDTGKPMVYTSGTFKEDTKHYGSYLRQLKELECWARTDMYCTDSQFELAGIDL